ncbi:hypothetical protein DV736_g3367, partial [Chaetothyriales sp. CBS 134916]
MDHTQVKALAALQPFIHLAATTKNASHRVVADLITRATSAPGTYVFTELLQIPVIQSLRSPDTPAEYRAYLTVLELFSWGTYEEYKSTASLKPPPHLSSPASDATANILYSTDTPHLPALNDAQTLKLRQLSLLSLASPFLPTAAAPSSPVALSYPSLIAALSLPDGSALESLVTSAIYASLVNASLSPTSLPPTVHIHSVSPLRDLRPQSLPALLAILSTWSSRCDSVVTSLQGNIDTIKASARSRNTLAAARQSRVDNAVLKVHADTANEGDDKQGTNSSKASQGLRGSKRDLDADDDVDSEEDAMDMDEGFGDLGHAYATPLSAGGDAGGSSAAGPSRGTKRGRPRG